jgi:hypothetical protein
MNLGHLFSLKLNLLILIVGYCLLQNVKAPKKSLPKILLLLETGYENVQNNLHFIQE